MTYLTSTLGALTLSALSALTFLACNGSGGALTPEEQIARFCDDTTTPACDAFFGCCDGSSALNGYGTVGGCESSLGGSCNAEVTDALLPLITAGSMVLDEARLAACVSKLEGLKAGGAACVLHPHVRLRRGVPRDHRPGPALRRAQGLGQRARVPAVRRRYLSGWQMPGVPRHRRRLHAGAERSGRGAPLQLRERRVVYRQRVDGPLRSARQDRRGVRGPRRKHPGV
jgi:hypothetical protein